MRVLIIDPLHNTPGEHDDDGAFEPGAEKLAKAFAGAGVDATRFSFDNTFGYDARVAQLRSFITGKQFDALVEVSHGLHTKLQSGISVINDHLVLNDFAPPAPKVAVLLACSAASPPIESSIAYQLARDGLEVLAHATVGHAFLNPFVVHVRPGATIDAPQPHDFVVLPFSSNWHAWTVEPARFYRGPTGFIHWTP